DPPRNGLKNWPRNWPRTVRHGAARNGRGSQKSPENRAFLTLTPTARNENKRRGALFFTEDTPTAVLVRQVLGAIAQFEKTSLVAKLKAARDRKRAEIGKCGGRKSYAEGRPETVALAKQLKRKSPRLSLRAISAALRDKGHTAGSGQPYSASAVQSMLG